MDLRRYLSWRFLLASFFAVAVLFGGLYALRFHANGWGEPADWGTFGDYVGGIANPVFGFFTVWLLIWSLTEERERSVRAERIALQSKRLESAMQEWERAIEVDVTVTGGNDFTRTTSVPVTLLASVKELFENENYLKYAEAWMAVHETAPADLYAACSHAADLLEEMSEYCTQLNKTDEEETLATFYHRRLWRAARYLKTIKRVGATYFDGSRPTRGRTPVVAAGFGDVDTVLVGKERS